MKDIITYLPALAIMIVCNILLGTVYNTSVKEMQFDKFIFIDGIKKAVCIAVGFIGLAYVFDIIPIGGDVITPQLIVTAAIVTYASKACMNLAKVLGVEDIINKE